jgi:hypothetical protein
MKAESESSLLVQDLLYTGFFVETSEQREERLNTQGEFARKAAMIFGDKRDEALQSLAPDKLYIRDQIKLAKNGKEAKYRTGLDLLVAIKIAAGERIPDSDADRKILLKSVLGTPDYSDKEVFSNGNWLQWEFRSVIQNQDTEKYTEHAKLVFGPKLMVTVSGPNGFGEKDGGIRSPNGRTTQTYESIESLLIIYSSVIESYFR